MNTQPETSPAGIAYDQSLDAKGLNCPLPVLKAKLALNRMLAGEILHVAATDPHAIIDFEAYCARTGHEIIRTVKSQEVIEFYIRRAAQPHKV
jgi:tRNA 2-thiouridine synthesizing protein A